MKIVTSSTLPYMKLRNPSILFTALKSLDIIVLSLFINLVVENMKPFRFVNLVVFFKQKHETTVLNHAHGTLYILGHGENFELLSSCNSDLFDQCNYVFFQNRPWRM